MEQIETMINKNNYAGIWIRCAAAALEIAIQISLFVIIIYWAVTPGGGLVALSSKFLWAVLLGLLVNSLIWFFLVPYLISKHGGSVGKLLLGLQIKNEDGSNLTFKQALFREYVGKFASNALFGAGFFWIAKTPKRQGWHDMLSGTVVIVDNETKNTGLVVMVVVLGLELYLLFMSFIKVYANPNFKTDLETASEEMRNMLNNKESSSTPANLLNEDTFLND